MRQLEGVGLNMRPTTVTRIALCALLAAVRLAPASCWFLHAPIKTMRDNSCGPDPLQRAQAPSKGSTSRPRGSLPMSRDTPYMRAAPAALRWTPKSGKEPLILLIGFMGATPAIMVCRRVPAAH